MKPWSVDMDMEKEEIRSVPIWIQLKLNIKYWGEKALFKIVNQIGKPVKRDSATTNRDKFHFARVLVDMPITHSLPDQVSFMDEHGELIKVDIKYEWKPSKCGVCKMVGHQDAECRQGNRKAWVQKHSMQPVKPMVQAPAVDQEGFQQALRPIRVRNSIAAPTHLKNTFHLLNEEEIGEVEHVVVEVDIEDGAAHKQGVVKQFIHKHHVGLVGLLEHKVKVPNLGNLYQKVFLNWCFTSNSSYHDGGRIVLAWNPSSFVVTILQVTSQLIHCLVKPVGGSSSFYCTFIYDVNESHKRLDLWSNLKALYTQDAWIMCGDFNCVMTTEEKIGAPVRNAEIVDICQCMHFCGMEDIKSVGNYYTWNNKQQGAARVFSKLDRIMANSNWQTQFPTAEVCFMNEGTFDHSPGFLTV
ncbi:uncharacterized protein [Spinacia oleracea]|uniref:DUF4283 domain-containing protein n=1 Tax=Spinacia oleracea TaxID=3562 RepID=A0A9R0IJZ5_SPIOL|nr:uncharacterized protein LOC110790035 [Spinacia oleracea]